MVRLRVPKSVRMETFRQLLQGIERERARVIQSLVVVDDVLAADRLDTVPARPPPEVRDRDRLVTVRRQQEEIRVPLDHLFEANLRKRLRQIAGDRLTPSRADDLSNERPVPN